MRRTRIIGALLTAAALTGCAGVSCPTPVAMDTLPSSISARIDTSRPTESRVSRASASTPGSDLVVRLSSHDAVKPLLNANHGPVVLTMTRRNEHWVVPLIVVSVDGLTQTVEFKVDTGAQTQLAVDSRTAAQLGVVVPQELPEGITHTAFGPKRVRTGVLAEVRLGSATMGPVGVEIECSGRTYTPLMGLRALERFGHAVFDWDRGQLVLIPRGWTSRTESAASDEHWSAMAWGSGPVSLTRDSIELEGTGRRRVLVEMSSRWSRLTLEDRERVTLIDTGFSGDLFAFEPQEVASSRSSTVVGQGFGRRDVFRTKVLDWPVQFSGVPFSGLTLIEPVSDFRSMDLVQRAGFEVMVGLGVLERFPMWLDFERGEVRLWTGSGPMPSVVAIEED